MTSGASHKRKCETKGARGFSVDMYQPMMNSPQNYFWLSPLVKTVGILSGEKNKMNF